MERMTIKKLESLVSHLNKVTNSPELPYISGAAQIGNFCLDEAYGGVGLNRISNSGGGVTCIFTITTRRELYNQIRAYIDGFNLNS